MSVDIFPHTVAAQLALSMGFRLARADHGQYCADSVVRCSISGTGLAGSQSQEVATEVGTPFTHCRNDPHTDKL